MSPAAKRRRLNAPTMAPKRRLGKFARSNNRSKRPRTSGSIKKQVASLSAIVKSDHKKIARSMDYCDFSLATATHTPLYASWSLLPLLQPDSWIPTRRRSLLTDTSQEATLLSMKVFISARHATADVQTVSWNFYIFHGKHDWYQNAVAVNGLRNEVDYTSMGPGCPVVLNSDNVKVLKRWTFRTHGRTAGDEASTSMKQRVFSFKLKKLLKRTPTTGTAAAYRWKLMPSTDFDPREQYYLGWYVDTVDATAMTNSNFTVSAAYTVSML